MPAARLSKRDRLIESLLARPEFVDYWSYKWSDLLLVNSERLRPAAMWSYYNWIRNSVAANTPFRRATMAPSPIWKKIDCPAVMTAAHSVLA